MKRNILLVTIAILIISLIAVGTSYGIGRHRLAVANNKAHEEMHEACGKDPKMQKMMEQMHGKDAEKHHDEMGKNMSRHMNDDSHMKGMMGNSGMMGASL